MKVALTGARLQPRAAPRPAAKRSQTMISAVKVGEKAPDFTLKGQVSSVDGIFWLSTQSSTSRHHYAPTFIGT
jgi:hypothetical protein